MQAIRSILYVNFIFLLPLAYLEIIENPISQSMNENSPGASLILTCKASAYPIASVVWYQNGNVIFDNVATMTNSLNITTSVINITTVSFSHDGKYFCQFSTSIGLLNTTVAVVNISRKLYLDIYNS